MYLFKKITLLSGEDAFEFEFKDKNIAKAPRIVCVALDEFCKWYDLAKENISQNIHWAPGTLKPHEPVEIRLWSSGYSFSYDVQIIVEYGEFKSMFQFCNGVLSGESIYTSDGKLIMARDEADLIPTIGPGYEKYDKYSDTLIAKLNQSHFHPTSRCRFSPILSYLMEGIPEIDALSKYTDTVCDGEKLLNHRLTDSDQRSKYLSIINKTMPQLFTAEKIKSLTENEVLFENRAGETVSLGVDSMGGGFNQVLYILKCAVYSKTSPVMVILYDWTNHLHPILKNALWEFLNSSNKEGVDFEGKLVCCSYDE